MHIKHTRLAMGFGVLAALGIAGCADLLGLGGLIEADADATSDGAPVDAADEDGGVDVCNPTRGVCNPFPQCGCLENQNCEITTVYGDTICSAVGMTPLWSNCTGYGQCEKGATCIGGVCKPFCGTAADCEGLSPAGTNVTCEQVINYGTGKAVPGLTVCSAGCDPRNPFLICGPEVTCFPFPWNGLGKDHGDCVGPAGPGIGPDACTGTNLNEPCEPGYYCETDHECYAWCRVGHNDCTSGRTCVAFSGIQPVIAGVEYGLCAFQGD